MKLPDMGLIIDEPYISQILAGNKTWEMRSSRTGKREIIGLIKKSTKHVFGTAELFACEGPLNYEQLVDSTDKHGISKDKIDGGLLDKWNYAWKLKNIIQFDQPIPYNHPNGAVTWVKLNNEIKKKPYKPILETTKKSNLAHLDIQQELKQENELNNGMYSVATKVPVAKDGSAFLSELSRNGFYTVGEKGNEQKFASYDEALHFLRKMPKAKWRRPNENGNWGIVSAVEWK